MLADWFGRRAARPRREPQWRSARPVLETLEDRSTPSAVRAVPGFTANSLGPQDDSPSPAANLGFNINFFGVQTNTVFVNNNGNITIGQPFSQFTPTALNTANGGIPIIAAFFADVDTRGPGSGITTFGTDNLCGFPAFGVDYINVGYFDSHVDKLNSFQLILVSRPDTGAGNFDIEFNYDQIQWETGDIDSPTGNGLGGSSARVGYTNGSGNPGTFFELPGSGVPGSFLDGGPDALSSATLLSSTPGRLHFLVRNGQVIQAPTEGSAGNLDVTSGTKLFYPFRYVTDPATSDQEGNLTLVNLFPLAAAASSATGNACLDITAGGPSSQSLSGPTFPGPITVVFNQLPIGVSVVDPTGITASGKPFITMPVNNLPRDLPALRVHIKLHNPSLVAPSTFNLGYPMEVFAGTFDPSQF